MPTLDDLTDEQLADLLRAKGYKIPKGYTGPLADRPPGSNNSDLAVNAQRGKASADAAAKSYPSTFAEQPWTDPLFNNPVNRFVGDTIENIPGSVAKAARGFEQFREQTAPTDAQSQPWLGQDGPTDQQQQGARDFVLGSVGVQPGQVLANADEARRAGRLPQFIKSMPAETLRALKEDPIEEGSDLLAVAGAAHGALGFMGRMKGAIAARRAGTGLAVTGEPRVGPGDYADYSTPEGMFRDAPPEAPRQAPLQLAGHGSPVHDWFRENPARTLDQATRHFKDQGLTTSEAARIKGEVIAENQRPVDPMPVNPPDVPPDEGDSPSYTGSASDVYSSLQRSAVPRAQASAPAVVPRVPEPTEAVPPVQEPRTLDDISDHDLQEQLLSYGVDVHSRAGQRLLAASAPAAEAAGQSAPIDTAPVGTIYHASQRPQSPTVRTGDFSKRLMGEPHGIYYGYSPEEAARSAGLQGGPHHIHESDMPKNPLTVPIGGLDARAHEIAQGILSREGLPVSPFMEDNFDNPVVQQEVSAQLTKELAAQGHDGVVFTGDKHSEPYVVKLAAPESPVENVTKSAQSRSYQDVQDEIDNYTDQLEAKYGQGEPSGGNIWPEDHQKMGVPVPPTKVSGPEVAKLRSLYDERDAIGEADDRAELRASMGKMTPNAMTGPAESVDIESALAKLQKDANFGRAMAHGPTTLEKMRKDLYHAIVRANKDRYFAGVYAEARRPKGLPQSGAFVEGPPPEEVKPVVHQLYENYSDAKDASNGRWKQYGYGQGPDALLNQVDAIIHDLTHDGEPPMRPAVASAAELPQSESGHHPMMVATPDGDLQPVHVPHDAAGDFKAVGPAEDAKGYPRTLTNPEAFAARQSEIMSRPPAGKTNANGLTPPQQSFLADGLRDALPGLPEKATTERYIGNHMHGGGVWKPDFSIPDKNEATRTIHGDQSVTIQVPGDGRFVIGGKDQARNLLAAIGQPVGEKKTIPIHRTALAKEPNGGGYIYGVYHGEPLAGDTAQIFLGEPDVHASVKAEGETSNTVAPRETKIGFDVFKSAMESATKPVVPIHVNQDGAFNPVLLKSADGQEYHVAKKYLDQVYARGYTLEGGEQNAPLAVVDSNGNRRGVTLPMDANKQVQGDNLLPYKPPAIKKALVAQQGKPFVAESATEQIPEQSPSPEGEAPRPGDLIDPETGQVFRHKDAAEPNETPVDAAEQKAETKARAVDRKMQRGSITLPSQADMAAAVDAADDVRNLLFQNANHLRRHASPESVGHFYEMASAETKAAVLMNGHGVRIHAEMSENGGLPAFIAGVVESNQKGLESRWDRLGDDAMSVPNADLIGIRTRKGERFGEVAPDFAIGLGALSKYPAFQNPNVDLTANDLATQAAHTGDTTPLRRFLQMVFHDARDNVWHVPGLETDAAFTAHVTTPGFRRALPVYKAGFEPELMRSHFANEGIGRDDLGPLDTYIPRVPLDENGALFFGRPASGAEFGKPRNLHNEYATGQAPSYDLTPGALRNSMIDAFSRNSQAALMTSLENDGLLVSDGDPNVERDVQNGITKTYIMRDGRRIEARHVPITSARSALVNGRPVEVGRQWRIAPKWLVRELGPLVHHSLPEWEGGPSQVSNIVSPTLRKLTKVGLIVPVDLTIHATNLLNTAVQEIPRFEGTPALMNNVVTKKLAAIAAGIRIDPLSNANLMNAREMAQRGLLPAKYGGETWSSTVKEATGAYLARPTIQGLKDAHGSIEIMRELMKFNLGPLLFSNTGMDFTFRLMMFRNAKIMNELDPDQPIPEGFDRENEIRDYVNRLGIYNRALQGDMVRFLKDTEFGPFAVAGSTMNINALRYWSRLLHPNDSLPIGGTSTANRVKYKLASQFGAGAIALISAWIIAYEVNTGKKPWEDRKSKFLMIPLTPTQRRSPAGQALWGKGTDTAYFGFGGLVGPGYRGAGALGMRDYLDTRHEGGTAGQGQEAIGKAWLNAAGHPALSGPGFNALFSAITLKHPYVTSLRDRQGNPDFALKSAAEKFPPGAAGQLKARGLAAISGVNSGLGTALGESGIGPDADKWGKLPPMGRVARFVADLAFPGVIKGPYNIDKQERSIVQGERAAERPAHGSAVRMFSGGGRDRGR